MNLPPPNEFDVPEVLHGLGEMVGEDSSRALVGDVTEECRVLRVSVIIPTWNEESNIAAAISSAVKAGAAEIIVADGGSDDDTVAIASAAATVVECTASGRASQQNSGAAIASGDVLLFLHADCELHANAITEIRERCSSLGANVRGCFRQRIPRTGILYRIAEKGNEFRARLLNWAYGDQAIFVGAELFRSIGGFPDVVFLEDLLLMKKLKRRGPFVFMRSPLVVSPRRWERRGLVRQTLRNWAIVCAAHLGASPNWLARFYPNER